MFPFANTLAAGDQDVIYIGSMLLPDYAVTPPLSTLGATAGDFAMFSNANLIGPPFVSGSGQPWMEIGDGSAYRIHYRVLDAADVAAGITAPGGSILLVYRGPIVSRGFKAFVDQDQPRENGAVKSRAHVGFVAIGFSYSNVAPMETLSPGFTLRGRTNGDTRLAAFDRLSPPNPTYVDRTRFVSNTGYLRIFELRSE